MSIKIGTTTISGRTPVINNTSSTSTNTALSANMGREMQLEISHLQSIGRFLSFWNCATGLPTTSPQTSPYTYQTGDYYRVGEIATGGASNYKPNGSTYTTGVASTTVETGTVVVGQVYYYDGTSWNLAAGGGNINVDGVTISFNNDNELQTIGIKETNDNITTKVWTGTASEYEDIASKDSNTLYNITDDIGGSAPQIGAITEALNGKQDLLTGTATGGDYVIEYQVPTADNNYTWYRKYKSGWVEQGGIATSGSSWYTVNLPITMADTNYSIQVTPQDNNYIATCRTFNDQSTTSFKTIHQVPDGTCYSGKKDYWTVSGMYAQ